MVGTFGPYTSASRRPTWWPEFASANARLTETVVFPTPPLPEPTARICRIPVIGVCGGGCWAACGFIKLLLCQCVPLDCRAIHNLHQVVFQDVSLFHQGARRGEGP